MKSLTDQLILLVSDLRKQRINHEIAPSSVIDTLVKVRGYTHYT